MQTQTVFHMCGEYDTAVVTNKELLVLKELDGVYGANNQVQFVSLPLALYFSSRWMARPVARGQGRDNQI